MKRIFLLFTILLSLIFLAISASAANYTVPYAADAPVMDGVIDDVYLKGKPVDISAPSKDATAEGHSTGTAYFAYDEKFLYVVVDVIDDTPCPPAGTNGDKLSAYDGIMFAYNFSGENTKIASSTGTDAGYIQINLVNSSSTRNAINVKADASGNQTGYTIEFSIIWSKDYPLYDIKTGKVSFAMWLYDYGYDAATKEVQNYGYVMTHPLQEDAYSTAIGYDAKGNGLWDGLDMETVDYTAMDPKNLCVTFKCNGVPDTVMYPVTKDSKITAPDYPECEGIALGWVTPGKQFYAAGSKITVTEESKDLELLTVDLKALDGVSVRTSDANKMGMRFAATVSKADYDKISEYVSSVKTGALILPLSAANGVEITHQKLRGIHARFCDIINSGWNKEIGDDSVYGWYAAIKNIDPKYVATDFVFVPYVSFLDRYGSVQYVYADGQTVGNIYETAFLAFEDRDASYENQTDEGVNSKYTKDELSVLSEYIGRVISLSPQLDGTLMGKAPDSVGTSKYYKFNYYAIYNNGVLTLASFDGTSADFDKADFVFLGNRILELDSNGAAQVSFELDNSFDAIRLNQVGYRSDAVKRAIVTEGGNIFWVVDSTTGQIAYANAVEAGRYEPTAGEVVNYCDFTDFTTPGMYYLVVDLNYQKISYPFTISDDVLDPVHQLLLKAFYFNRCGCTIKDTEYSLYHAVCHTGDAKVLEFTDEYTVNANGDKAYEVRETGEVVSGSKLLGGWHDAGDYGRYTPWEANSVGKMMLSYILNPDAYGDDTGIPESGNGIPDVLDEARYTLEWLTNMQRADGAFYHRLTAMYHAGFDMEPTEDTSTFYLWPVSLEGTSTAAGALAIASYVYADIDPEFASKCLNLAITAYDWCKSNLSIGLYPADTGLTGNPRTSNYKLEFSYAASALYSATGDQSYHNDLLNYCTNITGQGTNHSVICAALNYILNPTDQPLNETIIKQYSNLFAAAGKNQTAKFNSTAYEFCYYVSLYANQGVIAISTALVLDELYNGSDNSLLISENINYILGKNATGYSGVLGVGYQQILNPHLRFYTPGWLTGGASEYSQLKARFAKYLETETRISPNDPPLKCYVDEYVYFQLNEPTISSNSNALIVFAYATK